MKSKSLLFVVFSLGGVAAMLAQSVPSVFQPGDLISAGQLNANFTALVNSFRSVMPVGSVRASLLDPATFASTAGDPSTFDATTSKWALADGRAVAGSAYASVSGSSNLPDLRGVFLRGINVGRADGNQDPDGERLPGAYQADLFASHNHNNGAWDRLVTVDGTYTFNSFDNCCAPNEPNLQDAQPMANAGGAETRPRNAAVYLYVRIN